MNQLQALHKLLGLLPENLSDIIAKADTIESQIKQAGTTVGEYQSKAQNWVDEYITKAPQFVDDFFASINNSLEASINYQKIKDQDLSDLLSVPQGFDMDDNSQMQTLVSGKVTALQNYLKPLEIKNNDTIFSGVNDILTDLMDIPEDMDLSDPTMSEMFKQLKLQTLQAKVNSLLEEAFGISLPDSTPEQDPQKGSASTNSTINPADIPEQLINDLESYIPQLEQQFQSMESEKMSVSSLVTVLKSLEPLLKKMASSLPIPDLDVDSQLSNLEPLLDEIATQAQTINTTQTDLMVDTGLKALLTLCNKYVKTGSPFEPLVEVLQKVQLVASYLIENNLLVPVQISKLSSNESLPQTGGMNVEWQAIQTTAITTQVAAPNLAHAADPPVAEHPTPPIAVNPGNGTDSGKDKAANQHAANTQAPIAEDQQNGVMAVLEKLIKEGMTKLSSEQNQWAQGLLNGNSFGVLMTEGETVANSLITKMEQLGQSITSDWQNKGLNSLGAIVSMAIAKVKALVMTIINTIKQLIDELLMILGTSITLLVDLTLNIKLPGNFLTSLVPTLNNLTKVNLLCLLVATPWDVVMKLKDLEADVIDAWMK